MIKLRHLKESDAEYMHEWMQDRDIQKCFRKRMNEMTVEQVKDFCCEASNSFQKQICTGESRHWAIVEDDNDEYLGTISLKEIDLENRNAEYAVVMRKEVQGKGIGLQATNLLLDIAFNQMKLHKVYLNVLEDNLRAIRMYERAGFVFEGVSKEQLYIDDRYVGLKWYSIFNSNY